MFPVFPVVPEDEPVPMALLGVLPMEPAPVVPVLPAPIPLAALVLLW